MLPFSDYHMHTPLCGHATGQPAEYVEHAISIGLQEMGFSDHAPLVSHDDPSITMNISQLPQYYRMIEEVQHTYRNEIRIKMALEADYVPGYEEKTRAILDDYAYDYVIGSVHFIKNWGFDDPAQREKWDQKDINAVYADYHDLLRRSAQSGLFDIMGHVDLVKKFGHRPTKDMTDEVRATAQVFKESGVVVEINTSGLRKPIGEMYPSLEYLKIYCEVGVPLTFGSDAHSPGDVGCDYDKALKLARAAGYSKYVLFSRRKIERVVPI